MQNKFIRIVIKSIYTFAFIAVILGTLVAIKGIQFKTLMAMAAEMVTPPEAVTTAEVLTQDWNPVTKGVGDVVAVQGVTVTTEVPGKVIQIHFESGQDVEAEQILVELDASTERAQLDSAIASADLAKISLNRARELFANDAIAQSELDAALAQSTEAEARVKNLQAVLAKKVIRAPFSGRLGIRQVNLGQYVGNGQEVVMLQKLDPIFVDFYVPQQKMSGVRPGYEVEVVTDDVGLSEWTGEVTAIAPKVDTSTRNAMVRASLCNPDGLLTPGMFVEVKVKLPSTRKVIVVPVTSIVYAPYGNSVFVAVKSETGDGYVASQRFVQVGETKGDFVEIKEGLEIGDLVVTTGGYKLREGGSLYINNEKGLKFSTNPKLQDA